ncbi:N-substituted formamide deformylase [Pseudidiomarina piscicola]|uniref:N-substituted formamide deformylase n=1 Tax=Pseudidiomarina piscicola TaxID=2614830 RepID=A0A6S6WRC9_9GAMM|nr:amidohydrolase [Pseudidiomarina piscicola]CAB0151814.1 N-substituted formamide deformylase [Pseudidiomarina piscicola]VZT41260.1 N-substituted formamide deformylase [Pseudomonas aeruginosa]
MRLVSSLLPLVLLVISFASNAQTVLYHNFSGYTLTGEPGEEALFKQFDAMLIRDGKVAAVGSLETLTTQLNQVPDRKIDLKGKTVLPGIIDAHGHMLGLGENLMQVDLRTASSEQDAVARVAEFAAEHTEQWVIGRGWNQENWTSRDFPSAQSLDEFMVERPVWLTRVDGHAGWANSKALELAGITAETVSPEGGEIIRDSSGQPTGVLVDNAMALVESQLPKKTAEYYRKALTAAFDHLVSEGITGVHDAGISATNLEVYQQLSAEGKMPVRVYAMLSASEPKLPELLAAGPITTADDSLTVRSVKIYTDGALGSRGAALLEPYSDAANTRGLLVTQPDAIEDLFNLVIPYGFQINIHAIGDRANRIALNTFAEAFGTIGGRNLRHRIEHSQVVHPNDIPRFKELDIIASMQPTHATSDKNMAEDRLGKERMAGAYAWQTFLEQGTIVAAGSDFPVELSNPFFGVHAAVTRQDRANNPQGGWYAHEAMTLKQALRAFTLDAAYAAGQERELGSLEPGKWADFIVLDQDPYKVSNAKLWQANVLATYVAGEAVYTQE